MAACLLLGFGLWELSERRRAARHSSRVRAIIPRDTPTFSTEDVGIVLATVHPDPDFARCLNSWLGNKPKEVIIVTVPRDVPAVEDHVAKVARDQHKIRILTVDEANHRTQQICGIRAATGKVLAMVDDDTFCVGPDVLKWRLAPLEDPAVAGVTGKHTADFSEERRDPNVGTIWEALSTRGLENFNGLAQTRFGADGAVWCLIGCSQVLRAEVVQQKDFLEDYRTQTFRGTAVKAGGDTWMARLLMERGHKLAFQCAPEGLVYTTPKIDKSFVWQMARWMRSTYINHLSMCIERPGFFALRRRHPYMARKMVERMLRPILSPLHLFVWIWTLKTAPLIGILTGLWHLYLYHKAYQRFSNKFPRLGRHVWALFFMDTFGWFVLELYVLCTLASESWVHKNGESSLGAGKVMLEALSPVNERKAEKGTQTIEVRPAEKLLPAEEPISRCEERGRRACSWPCSSGK